MSLQKRHVFWYFFIPFLVALVYSVTRYNVFKGVPLEHFPLFIFNKVISLTSVILIGLSFILGPLTRFSSFFSSKLHLRKPLGLFGFGLGSIHALMSLLLFSPAYYAKFFDGNQLNLVGELSMLFGVLAFFIFAIVALTSFPSIEKSLDPRQWLLVQRTGYGAYAFVMLHVLVMGFSGWLTPDHWPGGLLPISLVAFLIISVVFIMRLIVLIFPKK